MEGEGGRRWKEEEREGKIKMGNDNTKNQGRKGKERRWKGREAEEEGSGMKMKTGLCRPPWQTVSGLQVLEGPVPGSEEAAGHHRCNRGPPVPPPTRYDDSSLLSAV